MASTEMGRHGIVVREQSRMPGIGHIVFSRKNRRLAPPAMPSGEMRLMPPPQIERSVPTPLVTRIMPLLMIAGSVGTVALNAAKNGWDSIVNQPMMLMMPIMMLAGVIGMLVGNKGSKVQAELAEERKDYFRYLDNTRVQVRKVVEQQWDYLLWNYPHPHTLLSLVGGARMWEREMKHPDFAIVRVGLGIQNLATALVPPEMGHTDDYEPVCATALSQFMLTHSVVHNVPTTISLQSYAVMQFVSPWEDNWSLLRAMLMELALLHSPEQLLISFITQNPESPEWSWGKWLPHSQHPYEDDALGARRLFFSSLDEWEKAFYDDLHSRNVFSRQPHHDSHASAPAVFHVVVFCDDSVKNKKGTILSAYGLDGVCILDSAYDESIGEYKWCNAITVRVGEGKIFAKNGGKFERFAISDEEEIYRATVFSRQLSRWCVAPRLLVEDGKAHFPVQVENSLPALLKIPDVKALTPSAIWKYREGKDRLRVPIGVDPHGNTVEVDIKEGSEYGYGPHGVCIGATGSGKSEFLRTLVLSMVATHSPEQLNLILVDFKGGATFLGFERLHHVAAVITNLEGEADLVQRMADALNGEMNRRQNVLREAGNYANVTDYNKDRHQGRDLPPFPALFIVVDEFTELLIQFPEFGNLFDTIGRLGRSLHIHMLLASQRLTGVSADKIMTNLSYRIALKTFTASDSRSIIGTADAFSLPNVPGSGYMRYNSAQEGEVLVRFDASYVSRPYVDPFTLASDHKNSSSLREETNRYNTTVAAFFPASLQPLSTIPSQQSPKNVPSTVVAPHEAKTLMHMLIDKLAGAGLRAHQVWLPPLCNPPTVHFLTGEHGGQPHTLVRLEIPIGIIDLPYYQRQDVLMMDFGSHIGFVGAPQAGKSLALRTIIMSAAYLNTPEQVQFYCCDFGGGSLHSLSELPHVGAVMGRLDVDAISRAIAQLLELISLREKMFKEYRIESMADYRYRKAHARQKGEKNFLTLDPYGDVYLVIDGYATMRQEFDTLIEDIDTIAHQGLAYGVHLIITSSRWVDIRPNIREKLLSRFELRLGDPADSELDIRAARRVPQNKPGRGIYMELSTDGSKKIFDILIGVPRLDNVPTNDNLSYAVAQASKQLNDMYPHHRAPAIKLLPERIYRHEVLNLLAESMQALSHCEAVIGIDQAHLRPVILNFDQAPLFLGFAAGESGKTTLLRNITHSLVENASAQQNQLIIFDYRRTMLADVDTSHIYSYVSSITQAESTMGEIIAILRQRIPPPEVTQQQLRDRSWWSGPNYYIIADDYDLMSQGGFNPSPLEPLIELLPIAKDIGLKVIIMRRAGGALRASMEPLLKTMRELNTDGIMMNGDKDEDAILGGNVKMSPQVPGRGTLVSRKHGSVIVQIADMPSIAG